MWLKYFCVSGKVLIVGVLILALRPPAAVAPALYTPEGKASSADVAASLLQGVAWIWPDSNGPAYRPSSPAAYREAAVLVESLVLRATTVEHRGRTRPLSLPVGVRVMPVLHIEAAADAPNAFTPLQRDAILAAVRRQSEVAVKGVGLLQIDFEAPARQRDAYRALLVSVRQALPPGVRLGVTALAHWCTQGDWLDQLPVDEVVPMLYRLGPHADDWRRRFTEGDSGLARRCRGAAMGFATNDPPPRALLVRTARAYWFDDTAWSNFSQPTVYIAP